MPETNTPPPVNTAARERLEESKAGLLAACEATTAADRYRVAYMAAHRAAFAVLRVRPEGSRGVGGTTWAKVTVVAPEMGEWASFFAGTRERAGAPLDWVSDTNRNLMHEWVAMMDRREARKDET